LELAVSVDALCIVVEQKHHPILDVDAMQPFCVWIGAME
jgi:hypothetical protein